MESRGDESEVVAVRSAVMGISFEGAEEYSTCTLGAFYPTTGTL